MMKYIISLGIIFQLRMGNTHYPFTTSNKNLCTQLPSSLCYNNNIPNACLKVVKCMRAEMLSFVEKWIALERMNERMWVRLWSFRCRVYRLPAAFGIGECHGQRKTIIQGQQKKDNLSFALLKLNFVVWTTGAKRYFQPHLWICMTLGKSIFFSIFEKLVFLNSSR